MAAKGGPQVWPCGQQSFCASLEGSVRLLFALQDRYGPGVLSGHDSLLVPVSPLDEPDGERGTTLLCQVLQPAEILQRIPQIRLHDDTHMRKVSKLSLCDDLSERALDKLLVPVLLDIEINERALPHRQPQQRA